jgi:AcrR family transcriptional regulator
MSSSARSQSSYYSSGLVAGAGSSDGSQERRSCRRPDRRHNLDVKAVDSRAAQPADPVRRRLTRAEAQAQTRRRVLEAAAEVFGEHGFRAASLNDVADRAGHTIGAVYSNFASKDELFRALMVERLRLFEAGLEAAAYQPTTGQPDIGADAGSRELRIESALDQMTAGEDSVPPRWWRLLYEYRTYAAADPAAWAELAALERRCRELMARSIEGFAAAFGTALPRSPMELAELTMALTDGLRAAHAEGRSTMTSGEGLRLVVKALIALSERTDPT